MMYLLVLFSFIAVGECRNYTDFFGRNISLPLSAALYSPTPLRCLKTKLNSTAIQIKRYNAHFHGGNCSGFIVTLSEYNATALTFKATLSRQHSEEHFVKNFRRFVFPLTTWTYEGNVSRYFNDTFTNLWIEKGMRRDFEEIMKNHTNHEVWVTGYSLGGGLAALVAFDISAGNLTKKDKLTLVTLGQPMVGDKKFSEAYDLKVENSFRVIRKGDMMPHLPGESRGYEYNGREVFYELYGMQSNGTSGFKICRNFTEDYCSGSQTSPLELEYNRDYFRRNVENYGKKCT